MKKDGDENVGRRDKEFFWGGGGEWLFAWILILK